MMVYFLGGYSLDCNCTVGNYPDKNCPGENFPAGDFLGGNCPSTSLNTLRSSPLLSKN